MKLLLVFSVLLAIAYSAPAIEKDTLPIAVIGENLFHPAKPQIDINISINGVPTPYYEQSLVYIEVRNPVQPPQVAVPGYEFLPFAPIEGGSDIIPDAGAIIL